METRISSQKIAMRFAAGIIFLLAVHLVLQTLKFAFGHDHVMGLTDMFDLNDENNIPTLFSFFLYVTAAKLLGWIAYESWASHRQLANRWAALSIVFAWLSLDELLALHEGWIAPLRGYFQTSGPMYFIWQLPYVILLAVLCVFCIPLWKSLPKEIRRWIIAAAGIFLSGVIVFESLEGWYWSTLGERQDAAFMLLATAEEVFEMSGLVVLIYALLEYCRLEIRQVNFRWET